MTTPHPDTPELDDILDDLQFESIISAPGDNVTKLQAISTAKATIKAKLAEAEQTGQVNALNYAYSLREMVIPVTGVSIYMVRANYIKERITQLQQRQAGEDDQP
jgi:hypothetical protein